MFINLKDTRGMWNLGSEHSVAMDTIPLKKETVAEALLVEGKVEVILLDAVVVDLLSLGHHPLAGSCGRVLLVDQVPERKEHWNVHSLLLVQYGVLK